MPFIKLAATEIVSGVSGESEQKIRELFTRAVVRKQLKTDSVVHSSKVNTLMWTLV